MTAVARSETLAHPSHSEYTIVQQSLVGFAEDFVRLQLRARPVMALNTSATTQPFTEGGRRSGWVEGGAGGFSLFL